MCLVFLEGIILHNAKKYVILQANKKSNDMTTVALNGLWAYIQTLNLSKRNRKWLAQKLVESDAKDMDDTEYLESSPAMMDIIRQGREEIAQGKGETVDVDDLWK